MNFLIGIGFTIGYIVCGLLTIKLGVRLKAIEMETIKEDDFPSIIILVLFWPVWLIIILAVTVYKKFSSSFHGPGLFKRIIRWVLR